MCGIVGIFNTREKRPVDRNLLRRMNDAIAHRGPDGDGEYFDDGIGLGHRRLAIIDLKTGDQPLFNEDGSVVVVFNGEIYNFRELVTELQGLGHTFRTHSDTEVIVHGWEEWGPACVERFRGMFAFALWDTNKETLFLARDRLGKKPVYYAALADGQVIFGSELKALAVCPQLPRDLDLYAVEDYFAYGYIPDPRSIFKSVSKLPPAHYLVWKRGGAPTLSAYWDVRMSEDGPDDFEAATDMLTANLREAVDLRLISDVPLGAFLSGGVDSSGIVALMAGLSQDPVNTFSISFGHGDYDESDYAAEVAQRYKTNHHVQSVDPDSFDLVDRLAGIYDEPYGDSSAMPTYRVCALARQHVTVALSGDGGDELFAGYRRYLFHQREERLRAMVPDAVRKPLFGLLARLYPKLDWAPRYLRAKNTFQELALDSAGGFFHSIAVLNDQVRSDIFSASFKSALGGYHASDVLRSHMAAAQTDNPLLQAQYADFKTWLPGDILVKVDRASMANSLEVRAPLLDHVFVEWGARLRDDFRLNGANGKHILKKAFEPLVPHHLLYRPKQGFSVPLAAWFRGPLKTRVRNAVTGDAMGDCGFFEMRVLSRLVDEHQSGRRDHSAVLWILLMFESFLRQNETPAAA